VHSFILPTPGFLFLFFVAGSANYPVCWWFVEKERWRIFAADWLGRADDFTNKSVLKDCSLKKKKKIFYKYCAWWLLMERTWFLLIITEISLWLILWCTWYPLFHCYCEFVIGDQTRKNIYLTSSTACQNSKLELWAVIII